MYARLDEARVHDPLEALLVLARETKSRMREFDFVTFLGIFGGILVALALFAYGGARLYYGLGDATTYELIGVGVISALAALFSWRISNFMIHFQRRLAAVERFIKFDPAPPVPAGPDPVARALNWLSAQDKRFEKLLRKSPERLARNVVPKGSKGYPFTAYYIRKSPFLPWERHLFVKTIEHPVTIEDLSQLKEAVETVVRKRKVPADHILAIQLLPDEIPEEVEQWIDDNWVLYPLGRKPGKEEQVCPVQLIVEGADGHYRLGCMYPG